jgi:hypothetical protein
LNDLRGFQQPSRACFRKRTLSSEAGAMECFTRTKLLQICRRFVVGSSFVANVTRIAGKWLHGGYMKAIYQTCRVETFPNILI